MPLLAGKAPLVALGVLGAAGAGVLIWQMNGRATDGRTAADFAPAETAVFAVANTDFSGDEWLQTIDLAARFDIDDPVADIADAAQSEGGVAWEEEVLPFLGGSLAYGVIADPEGEGPQMFVVLDASDPEQVEDVFLEDAGSEAVVTTSEYQGVAVTLAEDEVGDLWAWASVDGRLLAAEHEETLHLLIDTAQGREDSLADDPEFQAATEDAGSYLLMFAARAEGLLDLAALTGEYAAESAETDVLRDALTDQQLRGITTVVLRAEDGGFAGEVTTPVQDGFDFEPFEPALAERLPAGTVLAFGSRNMGEQVRAYRDQLAALDPATFADDEFGAEIVASIQRELEEYLSDEFLSGLSGEYALGLQLNFQDPSQTSGAFLIEGDAEQIYRYVLDELVQAGVPVQESGGSYPMAVIDDEAGQFAFGALDGIFVAGLPEALVTDMLEGATGGLTDTDAWQATWSEMPREVQAWGYVDVGGLLDMAMDGGSAMDLALPLEQLEALSGAGFAVTREGEIMKGRFFLSIE
jgi:hypothetical protein